MTNAHLWLCPSCSTYVYNAEDALVHRAKVHAYNFIKPNIILIEQGVV